MLLEKVEAPFIRLSFPFLSSFTSFFFVFCVFRLDYFVFSLLFQVIFRSFFFLSTSGRWRVFARVYLFVCGLLFIGRPQTYREAAHRTTNLTKVHHCHSVSFKKKKRNICFFRALLLRATKRKILVNRCVSGLLYTHI